MSPVVCYVAGFHHPGAPPPLELTSHLTDKASITARPCVGHLICSHVYCGDQLVPTHFLKYLVAANHWHVEHAYIG
jgi:hypothetical protein